MFSICNSSERAALTTNDFTPITELPGSLLNQEQLARITQRYRLGAALAQDKAVLEVSCGAGVGLGMLRQRARSLVASDFTYGVLAVAQQENAGQTPLVCADTHHLPFADDAFDLVLSFEAIYYLRRQDWFLREAHRLLRTGGTLLIGTSNPDWPHFVPGPMSVHYPSVVELATQLQRVGFRSLHFHGALPTPTTTTPRRRLIALACKYLMHHKFFTADNPLTRLLKQVAYGQLTPLPPALTTAASDSSSLAELTPLSPAASDRLHRVYFVIAYV